MDIRVTSVETPIWANAERTMIDCVITTNIFGDEKLPFTAMQTDIEAHGRELFASLVAGQYGPIAEYVAPVTGVQPEVSGAQTL